MAIDRGYVFTPDRYDEIVVSRVYPERTIREGIVISDFLERHAAEYSELWFSVRIGTPPDLKFEHLNGIKRMAWYALAKRIDILAWQGPRATIVEVKERVVPGVLGQVMTYRQLLLEEMPELEDPPLVVVGRTSDPDTLRVLSTNGITVYLYDAR
jgi:hypothetical protein